MTRKIFGILFIAAGLVALALPFVPGIPLIFIGLYLFGGGGYFKKKNIDPAGTN